MVSPDDHPLIKRGVFMLQAQIDNPFDLFKYWSLTGIWREGAPSVECLDCWHDGLESALKFT